jgi:phosphoserine phosphatase
VIFDCDSTLTTVEGIDVLAESSGHRKSVESLTQAAMDGKIELEEIYARRLETVSPTRRQIREIRRVYKRNPVEDAAAVIAVLQSLGHEVYIISGGLEEPVVEFGLFLGVPRAHIRAVGISYDELAGNWWRGDDLMAGGDDERYLEVMDNTLAESDGKGKIIGELLAGQPGRSLLVGDGYSDLLAGPAVDLFVGFGGVVKRRAVVEKAAAFVGSSSLSPVVALAAGPTALFGLDMSEHAAIASKALRLIREHGAITFQDERLKEKFRRAIDSTNDAAHQAFHPWTY